MRRRFFWEEGALIQTQLSPTACPFFSARFCTGRVTAPICESLAGRASEISGYFCLRYNLCPSIYKEYLFWKPEIQEASKTICSQSYKQTAVAV